MHLAGRIALPEQGDSASQMKTGYLRRFILANLWGEGVAQPWNHRLDDSLCLQMQDGRAPRRVKGVDGLSEGTGGPAGT